MVKGESGRWWLAPFFGFVFCLIVKRSKLEVSKGKVLKGRILAEAGQPVTICHQFKLRAADLRKLEELDESLVCAKFALPKKLTIIYISLTTVVGLIVP